MRRRNKRGPDRSWIDDLKPDEIRALEEQALLPPDCNGLPLSIGYSDRSDSDYVVSGGLGRRYGGGNSTYRCFDTLEEAEKWLKEKFGERLKSGPVWNQSESCPKWMALIRKWTP